MSSTAKKSIVLKLPDGESVKVKWFGRTSKADLQETICETAGYPAGTRFQLVDDEGDVCVISSSMPAGSHFTLKLVETKRAPAATKKRGRDADSGVTPPDAKAGKLTKLGSFEHDDVAEQVVTMGFDKSKVGPAIESLKLKRREVNAANIIQTIVETDRDTAAVAADAEEEEDCCCICLDSFESKKALFVTECGHKYHFQCIKSHCEQGSLNTAGSCPLCRMSLPTPPGVVGSRNPQAHRDRALHVYVPGEDRDSSASRRRRRHERNRRSNRDQYSSSGEETHLVVGRAEHNENPPLIEEWTYDFEVKVIKGSVYNYPGHEDGAPISTSPVQSVDDADGYSFRTASGSRYALGTPDPEFIDMLGEYFQEDDPLRALLGFNTLQDMLQQPRPTADAEDEDDEEVVAAPETRSATAGGRRSRRNRTRSATSAGVN